MLAKGKKPKDDAAKKPVKKTGVMGKSDKNTTPKPSVASKKAKDTAETEEKKTTGVAKRSLKKETLLDGRSASATAKKTSTKKTETEPEKVERSAASAPGVKTAAKKTSTSTPTPEKKVTKPKTGASKSPAPALAKKSLTEKKPKKETGEPAAATEEKKTTSKKAETKGLARTATPPVPKPSLAKKLATKVLTPKGSGTEEKEKKPKEKSTLATKVRSGLQRALSSKKTKSEAPAAKTESPASAKTSTPKGKSARATLRPSQSPAPLPKERRKSASDVSARTLSVASGKSSTSSGVGAKKKGTKKKDTTPSVASTLSPPPTSDLASEDVSQLDSEALSTEIGIESKNDDSVVLTEGGLSYRSTLSSEPVEAIKEVEQEQSVDKDEDSKSPVVEEEVVVVDESAQGPKQPKGPVLQEMDPPTTMSTRSHSATPRDSRSVSREDDDDQMLSQGDTLEDAKVEEIKPPEQEKVLDFEEAGAKQTAAVEKEEKEDIAEKEEEKDISLNVSEDKAREIEVGHVQEPDGIKSATPPKQEDVLVASIGTTQDAVLQNRDEIVKEEDIGSQEMAKDNITGAGHRRILSCWSTMNEVAEEDRNQHLEEEEDAETEILEMHDEKSDQATVDHPELNTMSTLDEVFEQILDEGGFDTRSLGGFSSEHAGASSGGSMEERNADLDGFSELSGQPDLPPRSDLDENQTPPALTPRHITPRLGSSPTFTDPAAGVGEGEFFGDDYPSSDDLSLPEEVTEANKEWAARVESETGNAISEAMHSQGLESEDRHDSGSMVGVEQEADDEARDHDVDSLSDLSLPEEVIESNAAWTAALEEQPAVVREVQANEQEAAPAAQEVEARSLPASMIVERNQEQERLSAPDTPVVKQVLMEAVLPAPVEVHATRAVEKDEVSLQKDDAPMSTTAQVDQSTAKDSLSQPEEALDVHRDIDDDRLSQEVMVTPREDAHEDLSTPDENAYGEKTENESLPDTVKAAGSSDDDISLSEVLALPGHYEAEELSTPGRTLDPQTERSQPYDAPTSEDLLLSDWPSDDAVPSESGCDTDDLGSLPDPVYPDDDVEMPPKGGMNPLPERSRSSFEGTPGAPKGATTTTKLETTTQPPPPPSKRGIEDHSITATCDPQPSHQEDPVHDDLYEDPQSHAEPSDPPCKAHQDDSSRDRNEGNRRRGRGRTIVTWAVSVLGVAVTVILLTQRGH